MRWFDRLRENPRLTRWDAYVTVLAIAFWLGAVATRGHWIWPHCVSVEHTCTAAEVLRLDQPGIGVSNTAADLMSDTLQNSAAVLLFAGPLAWHAGLAIAGQTIGRAALAAAGTDFVLGLQTTAWNGIGIELSHLLSQRARPFVYGKPEASHDPSNYTSFYSGHTSFTAAAVFGLLLMLLSRGAPSWVIALVAAGGQGLIVTVAVLRVLAGRHFVTDVAVGAVAGVGVAMAVALAHRARAR